MPVSITRVAFRRSCFPSTARNVTRGSTERSSVSSDTSPACREYMICPLPRANDLTAPSKQPSCHRHRGGGDDLYPGCGGAGHEGVRGPGTGPEGAAAVDPRGRGFGRERAHRAALALAV